MRRLEDRGLETDVRWQKTDVGGQVNEFGSGEKRRSEDKKVRRLAEFKFRMRSTARRGGGKNRR